MSAEEIHTRGSTVRPPDIIRQLGVDAGGLKQLVAVRNTLHESLEKSREAGHLLRERSQKLQGRLQSPVVAQALVPLEEELETWTSLSQRIDKATQSMMSAQKPHDVVYKLRKILMGDPALDLDGYLAAVMQLQEALSFHRQELAAAGRWLREAVNCLETAESAHPRRTDRLRRILNDLKAEQAGGACDDDLLNVALGKLENEFKRLLEESCLPVRLPTKMGPQTGDAPFSSTELEYLFRFPSEVLKKLQVIISGLVGSVNYQRCLDAYQQSRIAQCRRSLEALGVEYLQNSTPELVDKVTWVELLTMIQKWTQQVEVVVKVLYAGERRLARLVFKDLGQPVWVECFSTVAQPGISEFLQFGESVSKSSPSPEKLCKLLEMMEGLGKSELSVIQVFDGQACGLIRSRYRELLKQVSHGAFKAFWEMRKWVEEQKEPQTHDGGVMKLCSFVVNYMNFLIRDYLEPLKKTLRSQQSRTWSDDEPPQQKSSLAQGILLPLQALERQVDARAEEILDRPLRHLFMMNNFQYLYTRVEKSHLKDSLDDSWTFGIGRKVDKHTLKYRSDFCRRLVMHLSHEGLTGTTTLGKSEARSLVRQSLKAFAAALDEIIRVRGTWVIQHDSLRDATRLYVTENVASAYRTYLERFGQLLEGHFSSSTKYVKYTPEMVEQMLSSLFNHSS